MYAVRMTARKKKPTSAINYSSSTTAGIMASENKPKNKPKNAKNVKKETPKGPVKFTKSGSPTRS